MPHPRQRRRAAVTLAVIGAVFAVAVGALVWAIRDHRIFPLADRCTVAAAGGVTFDLTTEQAGNAATISAVGVRAGVGVRGATIAVATALQESKLRNLAHGDRDSLGLFQQRPSQGWGSAAQVRDPVHASEKFYAALVKVRGWETLPLTEAAQKVQRSGFPDAYAAHEDEAAALAAALTGRRVAALTCRIHAASGLRREPLTSSGLTRRASAVRTDLERAFGKQSLSGFGTVGGGVGPAHDEGRAIDIRYRPLDAAHRVRGWATAQFLVANAEQLRIAAVSYGGRVWTASRSGDGWRSYAPGSSGTDPGSGLDHVHVEVLRGS